MAEMITVYAVDALKAAVSDLQQIQADVQASCNDELLKARNLLEEVQQEEANSSQMLDAAVAAEQEAHAALLSAQAALVAASAALAAAIAEENPFAIASATAAVAAAEMAVQAAQSAYDFAVQHHQTMERRYEMAQQCLKMTQEMLEELEILLQSGLTQLSEICIHGKDRLLSAYEDLVRYLNQISPAAASSFTDWKTYKPDEKKPAKPDLLHDRLNVSEEQIRASLAYLMATDENFRDIVKRLRAQLQEGADPRQVKTQICRNITGRICEEVVKNALEPFAETVSAQETKQLEDGTTKIDLVLKNLKVPIILGKGEGMAAPVGGTLAVEVKSGRKEYLLQQMEHLQFQAKGHQEYDASCTICTRDIKELPLETEEKLRQALRDAGSPLLGMLPSKEIIDNVCIDYVING